MRWEEEGTLPHICCCVYMEIISWKKKWKMFPPSFGHCASDWLAGGLLSGDRLHSYSSRQSQSKSRVIGQNSMPCSMWDLSLWPGIELTSPALEAQSPNLWTAGKVLQGQILWQPEEEGKKWLLEPTDGEGLRKKLLETFRYEHSQPTVTPQEAWGVNNPTSLFSLTLIS